METMNRVKKISLLAQKVALQRAFPESHASVRRNKLVWKASIQPTGLSDTYQTELTHSFEMCPKVFVLAPELVLFEDQPIPHRYLDGSLCLFLPRRAEWNQTMLISETTVPWACEWLFHYELWLATGEWHGGGVHPGDNKKAERSLNEQIG